MAYVVAPQSILTVTMRGKHELQDVMTVLHYRYNGSVDIPDGAAAIDAFWLQFQGAPGPFNEWVAALSSKVTGIRTQLQWTHMNRFAYVVKIKAGAEEGGVGGDAMPVNVAAAITKRTQNAGRDQVGTVHMPGVPSTYIINSALTVFAKNAYDTFATKLLAAISTAIPAAEFLPVLFKSSSPEVSPQIFNVETQPYSRIMRRRTVGVGS